ncbi:response regulator transcription factor [bacterium AH-315-C07]|nr:response regulator transcription factor [bacterium AH-315-C07]
MLKAIIVDDEEKARFNLKSLVSDYCDEVLVTDMVGTVAEAQEAIDGSKPDLVFLDINMKNETGFDLLKKVRECSFETIFTTAHDQYAVEAFKFNAVDYLLKPIDIQELIEAIKRVEARVKKGNDHTHISSLLELVNSNQTTIDKIGLPTMEGLIFIKICEIVRCEANDNYTFFFTMQGGKVLVSKTIKYYEELLKGHNFFRTHQSHLVNLEHIQKYVRGEGGYIEMCDGSSVLVSRRKKEEFLNSLSLLS